MNAVLDEEGVKWAVYGTYSGMHIYTNPDGADITPSTFDAVALYSGHDGQIRGAGVTSQVRMGMLVNGVDMNSGPSGTISAMHGEEEMAITVDAFRSTIRALKREGVVTEHPRLPERHRSSQRPAGSGFGFQLADAAIDRAALPARSMACNRAAAAFGPILLQTLHGPVATLSGAASNRFAVF